MSGRSVTAWARVTHSAALSSRSPGEAEGQRLHTAQHVGIAPAQRIGLEPELGQAAQDGGNGQPRLEARQGRSHAEVNGVAKRYMPIVRAPYVQILGMGELLRVAIRRAQIEKYAGAPPDLPPAQLDVLHGDPSHGLGRSIVAQELLDGRAGQKRIGGEGGEL